MSYTGSAALYSSSVHGHHNPKGIPFLMQLCHCSRNGRGMAREEMLNNAEGSEKYEVCVESA